jgi:peptide/nickel transport system permease protein
MRAIDVLLAFPSVLIALLMATAFQPGWITVIAATALLNVPGAARQVRAVVLTVKHLDYVEAGRALGASTLRTLMIDILPSLAGPVSALASIGIGTAILETAGLSFLGIGGDRTEPEWGTMLANAKDYWSKNPWGAIGPGAAISITVLGFHLLGGALHEWFAPETGRRTVR